MVSARKWAQLGVVLLMLFFVRALIASESPAIDRTEAARINNLGVALANQHSMEKAAARFEEARQKDPSLVIADVNLGIALFNLAKLEQARKVLTDAGSRDPNDPYVWYNLGLTARADSRHKEALEYFQRTARVAPLDADTHYFLGASYLQLEDYPRAIEEFETALKLNPLHASAEFSCARALQRSGQATQAREHLKRFEHLTREKIAPAITSTYGDQGRFSLARDVLPAESKVGAMIPVTLSPEALASEKSRRSNADTNSPGGGVCVISLGGKHSMDVVVLGRGEHAITAYRNRGDGTFTAVPAQQSGLMASGDAVACAVGDFDNDGLPDLAVAFKERVTLYRNTGGKFRDVTQSVGIQQLNRPAGLTFIDYDHDGDLDLFVTGTAAGKKGVGPNRLWRNNGNGSFTNVTDQTGFVEPGPTVAAVLSDLNNDRAVDLITTGSADGPSFFANPREGKFQRKPLYVDPTLPPTVGVYVFDFDKDGWMDVAVTHSGSPGLTLWRNLKGQGFQRVPLPLNDAKRGWGVTAVDIDNDGWLDLAVIVETTGGSELRVLRNLGPRGFEDVSAKLGLRGATLRDARSVIATDFNQDGASDLLVSQLSAAPILFRNKGGNRNHSLRIDLVGLVDNRSALGTKVEVFADGLWQKWEVAGAAGLGSQGATQIVAGLGSTERADIVRMLWPTGIPQDEIEVPAKEVLFNELDRRGSSCPTLFAWNGEKYVFISDVIGAAVIGHWISPTERNIADPDEWVKVDGAQLQQRDGYLSLRFGEPMEEVNYLDQVRLVAVDHPRGTLVFPDERFVGAPPFPSGKPVVAADAHPPAGAWDNNGNDVLALLRARDHEYVRDFSNLQFAGYSNLHRLTLDLGAWSSKNPLHMFLHGFIEYFTATSMYAAWQAGIEPVAPYLEAQLPDGTWRRVIDDMGFPAGLPRTIVVDLTGKLPDGTRRVRISTNLQIYWDQILVDNSAAQSAAIRQTELPLALATLAFRGYPEQVDGKTRGDLTYNYERASATGPFTRQRGAYTRYGEVTPLLKAVDDRFVVFGSGEDIDLEFGAVGLPQLPAGWKRDYFFYANGFVKDMDFYEAQPFTVSDLPFKAMNAYPYPASQSYPDDSSANAYRLEWNDRIDTADAVSSYRLNYRQRRSEPVTPAHH